MDIWAILVPIAVITVLSGPALAAATDHVGHIRFLPQRVTRRQRG